MASVEQRETLNSISDTVDFFSHFKTIDEDKDSDEESFHLPMLDCEDDINTNGKELLNGETEEEILNKFESSATPDIVDPKVEDSILNDDEELHKDGDEIHKDDDEIHKDDVIHKDGDEFRKDDDEILKDDDESHKVNDKVREGDDVVSKDDNLDNKNTDIVNETKEIVSSEISENITEENVSVMDSVEENECKETKVNENDLSEKLFENKNNEISDLSNECSDENTLNNVKDEMKDNSKSCDDKEISEELDSEKLINKEDEEKIDTIESVELDDEKLQTSALTTENSSEKSPAPVETVSEESCAEAKDKDTVTNKLDVDMDSNLIESDKAATDINNQMETVDDMETEVHTTTTIKDIESDTHDKIVDARDDEDDAMEIEEDSRSNIGSTTNTADAKADIDVSEESGTKCDKPVTEETVKIDDIIDKEDSQKIENEPNSEQASNILNNKTEETKDEHLSERCKSTDLQEDSNKMDSSKDDNLACDDLLDISIIRDVDEDNAKADAEVNDAQSSDKSDNDEQDDYKADNDIEESEADQEDNLGSSDKDEAMDFEDGTSSNLCIEDSSTNDNITNENTSDSVNKIVEKVVSQVSKNILNDDSNSSQKLISEKAGLEPPECPEEPAVYLDLDKHMAEQANVVEQEFPLHGKRSLSQEGIESDLSNKKIKLSESTPSPDKGELKTLLSFEKFMQSKRFRHKLTRSDLEQFCLQKICEAIIHRSEVGELHQTIKKQEQVIDSLRKDIQQLSKQTRDLDIVHKKLMNELKAQNGNKKPLAPLKITRSVGLQVKLSVATDQTIKKKPGAPTTPGRTVSTPTTPIIRTRTIPAGNANVVRQVNANSPRKPASPAVSQANTTTPILTQVLQTPGRPLSTTITNRVPIKPKSAELQKPSGQGSGVIDLTDEDDKSSKVKPPVKILNKTLPLLGQTKLTSSIQLKNSKVKTNVGNKAVNGQAKAVAPPVKTVQTTPKGTTPVRTVTTLPQGVRLTPTQVKNGIAIPASVVTTNSAGGAQLMYVVQPSQIVTTTAGGQQKTVLLNFQPGNSILTSTLNGSAVSVIPTKTNNTVQLKTVTNPVRKHPASLPSPPFIPSNALLKPVLPKPHLSIRKTDTGIILQWRMPYNLDLYEAIASYQLYAYQETNAPPSTDMWRKVGDVKALALPMACTLTQFADKNKYYFAVRSIDVHKRIGAFSDPEEISL